MAIIVLYSILSMVIIFAAMLAVALIATFGTIGLAVLAGRVCDIYHDRKGGDPHA